MIILSFKTTANYIQIVGHTLKLDVYIIENLGFL